MAFGGKAAGCRDFVASPHPLFPTTLRPQPLAAGLPRLEPVGRSAVQPQLFVKHARLLARVCRRGSPGMLDGNQGGEMERREG